MYSIKPLIFNYLTSIQKSDICHYLSLFSKKYQNLSAEEIMENYIEDEKYYLKLDVSRHEWIEDYIDDESFRKEALIYIKECKKKLDIKELQKPFVDKQKEFQKEQRKKAQEYKMSKEPATKPQIRYYKALCRQNAIDEKIMDIEKASKLDLKNAIDTLLKESERIEKEIILTRLQEIIKSKENG